MAEKDKRVRTKIAKNAYPEKLRQVELGLWRRGQTNRGGSFDKNCEHSGKEQKDRPMVGFGLSGGGIRSATFCLGVFQALASANLLREIDYISSVSGGGFFAAFYGRMFFREEINGYDDIAKILSPDERMRLDVSRRCSWIAGIFQWLRDNGRYLSPRNGDLLVGITVFLRNWLTVQLLLAATLLAVFLAARLLQLEPTTIHELLPFSNPFLLLSGVLTLVGLVPLGWAYWTFSLPDSVASPGSEKSGRALKRLKWQFTVHGLGALLALAALLLLIRRAAGTYFNLSPSLAAVIVVLTVIFWQLSLCWAARKKPRVWALFTISICALIAGYHFGVEKRWALVILAALTEIIVISLWPECLLERVQDTVDPSCLVNYSQKGRTLLTQWLRTVLLITVALGAFGGIDAAGKWVSTSLSNSTLWVGLSTLYGVVAVIAPFVQSAFNARMPGEPGARIRLSLRSVSAIGATIVILPMLIGLDALSHKIAEADVHSKSATLIIAPGQIDRRAAVDSNRQAAVLDDSAPAGQSEMRLEGRVATFAYSITAGPGPGRVAAVLLLTIGFLLLTSSMNSSISWVFVNRTSLHALYGARLIRAYLGASNRARYSRTDYQRGTADKQDQTAPIGVSDPVHGDDIMQEDYWPALDHPVWQKAPPLHLVNVTINETIEGRSQVEERDRKGLGMAIGPAGFSVGVNQHLVITKDTSKNANRDIRAEVFPQGKAFRVFGDRRGPNHFSGEKLSLGNWTAISGAAVSTGLGSIGSIGASLLTGFFNLRLGYWWDSGTRSIAVGQEPMPLNTAEWRWKERAWYHIRMLFTVRFSRNVGKWLAWLFPVQSALLDELMGRFRGTLRRRWNLTDGGHFENLAGYELIRRRLPLIVIVDASGDPRYEFADLANLIRKARLDFNAEIRFLDPDKENDEFTRGLTRFRQNFSGKNLDRKVFGTLDQLRRGEWAEEPPKGEKAFFKSFDTQRLSRRHAALARINYLDEVAVIDRDKDYDPASYLLLIKPTLMGEEPQDLLNYHSANPEYPHQSTLNQFFDEAQWESYRRLGLHIAERVFGFSSQPSRSSALMRSMLNF